MVEEGYDMGNLWGVEYEEGRVELNGEGGEYMKEREVVER